MIEFKLYISKRKDKKLMVVFYNPDTLKTKTIHFGAKGYSDFTKHKDVKRRELYLKRHEKNENWDNFQTAGSLSRYILWNKPTLDNSIKDFKKRFNLKYTGTFGKGLSEKKY
jgi:hypothetical protein